MLADRQVEGYAKAVKAMADGLEANIRAFEEGSDVEKAQAAMNIASAVCLAIPPRAGQAGQALMSLGSFVAGLFGGGDGNALGMLWERCCSL